MTSNRVARAAGPAAARTGIALSFLVVAAVALAVFSACGSDDVTTNNYIGVTDAAPPRLGRSNAADGGAAP
jgi:hypothetical protein